MIHITGPAAVMFSNANVSRINLAVKPHKFLKLYRVVTGLNSIIVSVNSIGADSLLSVAPWPQFSTSK